MNEESKSLLGKRFHLSDSELDSSSLMKNKNEFIPFWNDCSRKAIDKWLLPNSSDYIHVPVSNWETFSNLTIQRSWFTLNVKKSTETLVKLRTSADLSATDTFHRYLWKEILNKHEEHNDIKETPIIKKVKLNTEKKKKKNKNKKEKEEKPPPAKCRKIRIYPNKDEVQTLRKFFGAVRKTYNLCLDAVNKKLCKSNKKELRDRFINSEILKTNTELSWLLEVPYDIRNHGMEDLLKNIKSNLAKKKKNKNKNKEHQFELKFRSKKDYQQSFVIPSKHWNSNGVYGFFRKIKSSELIQTIEYDSRLIYDKYGHYYICIPLPLKVRSENQAPIYQRSEGVIALDPGIRKFMTSYDSSGLVTQWGVNDIKRIERLCWYYDDLQSRWSSSELIHRKRYKLKKAGKRIMNKMKNLVNELHKKLCKWLCENYRVILLPKFETSKMIKYSHSRKLNSKTARNMLTLSHYRFQQRLIDKAREYPWCNVIIVSEEYTSKTCSGCGSINRKLGGSELFKCSDKTCLRKIDRDINGAMNILTRYLTIHKI